MPNPVGRFPVAAAAKAKEITSIMFLHSNKKYYQHYSRLSFGFYLLLCAIGNEKVIRGPWTSYLSSGAVSVNVISLIDAASEPMN